MNVDGDSEIYTQTDSESDWPRLCCRLDAVLSGGRMAARPGERTRAGWDRGRRPLQSPRGRMTKGVVRLGKPSRRRLHRDETTASIGVTLEKQTIVGSPFKCSDFTVNANEELLRAVRLGNRRPPLRLLEVKHCRQTLQKQSPIV